MQWITFDTIRGVRCVYNAGGILARALSQPKLQQEHLSRCETISGLREEHVQGASMVSPLHRRSTRWGWPLCRALSADWRFQARPWSLPPVTHQHDFHWRPRAGGAPSGKYKQTWRPWEYKCTDRAHLTLCEYGRHQRYWRREHVFDMRACVSVQSVLAASSLEKGFGSF